MNNQDLMGVDIDALVVGCQLQYPLYGNHGILLVSEGATVTSEFTRLLVDRGIQKVQIHRNDAPRVLRDPTQAENGPSLPINTDVCEQLDEMIDSGVFRSENIGPAVRDSMIIRGRKPYDQKQRERLNSQHRDSTDTLNSMMLEAAKDGTVDGTDMGRLTAANLESMTEDSENVITVVSEINDKDVSEQSLQTALLGMAIGIEMGLDAKNVRIIGTTGLVGDWGTMHLPEDVRGIKRQVDEREACEIRKIPILTANMLQKTSGLPRLVLPIAYQIHEKPDGTGYPKGRDSSSIHPLAKILPVADLYTALTSPGPSRRPATPYAAMKCILRKASVNSVDSDAARALLHILSLFPIGSYVALSNRSVARVLRRNGDNYSCPVVQVVLDGSGNRIFRDNEYAVIVPAEVGIEITRALPTPGKNELSSVELLRLRT